MEGSNKPGTFQPGNPGRPKGIPNKLSRTVRETVLEVFNKLQDDPANNLEAFAINEPVEFYRIAAKLIPTEVNAKVEGMVFNFNIVPDAECDRIDD